MRYQGSPHEGFAIRFDLPDCVVGTTNSQPAVETTVCMEAIESACRSCLPSVVGPPRLTDSRYDLVRTLANRSGFVMTVLHVLYVGLLFITPTFKFSDDCNVIALHFFTR